MVHTTPKTPPWYKKLHQDMKVTSRGSVASHFSFENNNNYVQQNGGGALRSKGGENGSIRHNGGDTGVITANGGERGDDSYAKHHNGGELGLITPNGGDSSYYKHNGGYLRAESINSDRSRTSSLGSPLGSPEKSPMFPMYSQEERKPEPERIITSQSIEELEVITADDKLEDGREAIPNIKSLRSRFESSEGGKSGGDWRSSANGERSSTISSSSRASRWDKPKGDVPAPINRKSDDEELDGPEDLPQPSHTRNMLAKFKQIEGEPGQVQQQTVTTVKKTSSVSTRNARPSPDSGIYETESYTNGQNGHSKEREVDTEELPGSGFTKNLVAQWRNKEQESGLKSPSPSTNKNPVRSFSARSTSQRSVTPDRNSDRNSDRVSDRTSERHISESNDFNVSEHDDYMDSPRSDVVRETDRHDEDELPPPSFTRNMLAKFQSMQEEAAQREATTVKPVSKKAGSGSQVY